MQISEEFDSGNPELDERGGRGGFRDNMSQPTEKFDSKPALPRHIPPKNPIHCDVL
jgi:hypothetical protein